MNTDYSTFNYNDDFTPIYNVFNVNTANKRFVGIGTHNPNEFLDIIGNVSTSNLLVQKNIYYNTTSDNLLNNFDINTNNIHLFSLDNNKRVITPNLVSSNYEETGIEWSIVNNNNIKLTLRNINDNTRLHYNSNFYNIENTFSKDIDLYIDSTVTLKYLYITEKNNSLLPVNLTSNSINNINSNINNNNIIITISDSSNNKITKLTNSNNSLFKFENFITLSKGVYNFNVTALNGFTIQFIGTYDYYAGSLWNKSNSTVTILKNVGIGTSTVSNNLHVIGNTVFTGNLHVNKNLNTNILNSSELNVNGYVNVDKIEPIENSLIINPNKTPIGIGSKNPSDFLDIGNNFKINSNGNIIFHNLNFTNPNNSSHTNINHAYITLSDHISFLHNNSSITINNSNNFNNFNNSITNFKLNNKTILNDNPESMQLFSKLSIYDISTTPSVNNESSDILYVNGNVNIYGDLTANINKDFIHNPTSTYLNNSINTQNTIVSDLLHSEGFLFTDTLESTNINIKKHFNLPIQYNDIPLHDYSYIYYNQTTNKYMIYNSNNSYSINTNITLMDFSNIVEIFTNNASKINFINTENIITNILENNKNFYLDTAQLNYNVNLNNSEIIINNTPYCFDLF